MKQQQQQYQPPTQMEHEMKSLQSKIMELENKLSFNNQYGGEDDQATEVKKGVTWATES